MDPAWISRVNRFADLLAMVRRELDSPTTSPQLEQFADTLRLVPGEQSRYQQLVREASRMPAEVPGQTPNTLRPFLNQDEERILFLACDHTVWGIQPFVLRSLLRQVLLELVALRSLPLEDEHPFAYASFVRAELGAHKTVSVR